MPKKVTYSQSQKIVDLLLDYSNTSVVLSTVQIRGIANLINNLIEQIKLEEERAEMYKEAWETSNKQSDILVEIIKRIN
jgi:hypothetical protein